MRKRIFASILLTIILIFTMSNVYAFSLPISKLGTARSISALLSEDEIPVIPENRNAGIDNNETYGPFIEEVSSEVIDETQADPTDSFEETLSMEMDQEVSDIEPNQDQSPLVKSYLNMGYALEDAMTIALAEPGTLQDIINATPDEGTITLETDYKENIVIPIDKNLTINLNGHQLIVDCPDDVSNTLDLITVYGKLTVTDPTANGQITAYDSITDTIAKDVRAVTVTNNAEFTLAGGTITGFNVAGNGAGVRIEMTGKFNMTGGTILDNTATEYGGGIFTYSSENLSLTGGLIQNNNAKNGGGLTIYNTGKPYNISNTSFVGNRAEENGGAIYIDQTIELSLERVTLDANSANNGGGIYFLAKASLSIPEGVEIKNNMAGANGAGLCFNVGSTLDISGTQISQNSSQGKGGGIYMPQGSTVNMTAGSINNNSARTHGGGINIESASGANKSTFNLTGGSIEGNYLTAVRNNEAQAYGAGIAMGTSSVLNISGQNTKITNNSGASYGGGFYTNTSSTITLSEAEISGNTAEAYTAATGGGFYIDNTSTFTMTSGKIINNKSLNSNENVDSARHDGNGAGFTLYGASSKGEISGGEISNNTATGVGGGFYIYNSSLTLKGDTVIENNTANNGGGIYGTTLNMQDGTIRGNAAASEGGGLYISNLVLSGGLIENNTATTGGAARINTNLTMSGGEVYNNSASGSSGAFYFYNGIADISGGKIIGNKAGSYAGAIYFGTTNTAKEKSYIRGSAQIIGNEATTYGGAIVLNHNQKLIIDGGEISGNYAKTNGGGIYQGEHGSELQVNNGKLHSNRAKGLGNDIYTNSVYNSSYSRPIFELSDARNMGDGTSESRWLEQQEATREITFDNLEWTEEQKQVDSESSTHASKTWAITFVGAQTEPVAQIGTEQYDLLQMALNAIEEETAQGTNILLLRDTLESVSVPAGKEITLDLAGHSISAQTGSTISVENSTTLTILDSSEDSSGRIQGGKGTVDRRDTSGNTYTYGGGIFVDKNSNLILDSGTITENKADIGGGVYLSNGSTFEMNGGKITENTGAGVYAYYTGQDDEAANGGAEFTLNSGEISKNTVSGVAGNGLSVVRIAGGEIIDNTATYGAGIYMTSGNTTSNAPKGQLIISGGRIAGNVASSYGGGVSHARFNFVMTGGEITENEAPSYAGVYYNSNSSDISFNMTAGKIYNNHLSNTGRGSDIYFVSNSNIQSLIPASRMGVENIDCWQDFLKSSFYQEDTIEEIIGRKDTIHDLFATTSERIHEEAIARIGNREFTNLQAAVYYNKAEEEDPTIYLLKDVEESIIVNEKREIVLDLNGYTLSPYTDQENLFYINDAYLTVKNSLDQDDSNEEDQGRLLNPKGNSARAAYLNGANNDQITGLRLENLIVDGFDYPKEGGAVYAKGYKLSLDLEKITIQNSQSETSGGAIYFSASDISTIGRSSSFKMIGSKILNNQAVTHGGGAYVYLGYTHVDEENTLLIEDSIFSENSAGQNSSSTYGGGLYLTGYTGTTTQKRAVSEINNTEFSKNTMQQGQGGGLFVTYQHSVDLDEVQLEENTAGTYGGAYLSATSDYQNYTLNKITVTDNHADTNYGGLAITGNVTLTNSEIIGNTAGNNYSGGGLLLSGTGDTIVKKTKIANNSARNGGGVVVTPSAQKKLLEDLTIKDNTALSYGGGIYINGTTSTIEPVEIVDSIIQNNEATYGGGISAGNSTGSNLKVAVKGNSQILKNRATNGWGGGIALSMNEAPNSFPGRLLDIQDGVEIKENSATGVGGGIYTSYIHTNIGKAEISDNHSDSNGGGVYISGAASEEDDATIFNGTLIKNNSALNGGGIFVNRVNEKYYFPVRVQSAVIRNNTATTSGGGFYNNSKCIDTVLEGTEISGNSVGSYGGGIYNASNSSLSFESRAIYGNKASLGQDVYSAYASGSTANLDLVLAEEMDLGESLEPLGWLDEERNTVIAERIHGELIKAYALTLEYVQRDKEVAEVVSDSTDSTEQDKFRSVQAAVDHVMDLFRDEDVSNDKNYIRMLDSSVENVTIPAEFSGILDLNGNVLEGYTTALTVAGNLTIRDSAEDNPDSTSQGTITGKAVTAGGGLYVKSGGDVTLESGHISNSSISIATNTTANGGAGVCIDAGTFRMTGGYIDHNIARYGSAVLVRNASSKFYMSGGVIENNNSGTPNNGTGTIYINQGEARITGGIIRNNETYASGGAINSNNGKLTISGASDDPVVIENNITRNAGGGIYVTGTVTLTNVRIEGNKTTSARNTTVTTSAGGGVYVESGTLTIGEGTEIRENQAVRGGGVFQNKGKVYMMGGLITKNVAEMGGGVAQNPSNQSIFSMLQGGLYDNRSKLTSIGNDFYSQYEGTGVYDPNLNASSTPRALLLPASEMGSFLYNVWKDDTYKGTEVEGDYILEGQYIKKTINQGVNLQLTAAYFDTTIESDTATDLTVTKIEIINDTDDGRSDGMVDGTSEWDAAKDLVTPEMSAAGLAATYPDQYKTSDKTYIYNGEPLNYIEYTPEEGEPVLYERDQIVTWSPGDDTGSNNSLIRTFDTVQYTLNFVVQGDDLGGEDEDTDGDIADSDDQNGGGLKEIRLWGEMWLPASSDELYFETTSLSNMKGYVVKEQTDSNGKSWQVLQGYWDEKVGKSGRVTEVMSLKVRGMKNGDTFKPYFRGWVGGNKNNETTPATCESKILTVSAYPKYNVTLDYNSDLSYTSYFNLNSGVETSETDPTAVRGTMLGYGVTVELYNDPVRKGLKGIEIPEKNLEFDLSLKGRLFLDGEPLTNEYIAPYFWAYKENEDTDYGKSLDSDLYSFSMNWNDEDDLNKTTNHAFNAAPFNSVGNGVEKSAYSGGGWKITGSQPQEDAKELKVHAKVNGYSFSWDDAYPNRTADNKPSSVFDSSAVKPFTAGYVQVLFPYQEEILSSPDINGYVAIGMDASVSNLSVKGISGNEPYSNTADQDGLSNLNHYYEKETASELLNGIAVREMKYGDNYAFQETGLYVFHGGPGESITKFNYFLDRGAGDLSKSEGKASTPLGSTVYISGKGQFSSKEYRTDDEEDLAHYIPDEEFNPLIHNKQEFNYMTAMNLLQKFDADAYTPVGADRIIDYRVNSKEKSQKIGPDNAFIISTDESKTSWAQETNEPYRNTTSYNLTILYAAKPDGTNWRKEDLDPAGRETWESKRFRGSKDQIDNDYALYNDGGVTEMDLYREENLIYFETMEDLRTYFKEQDINNDAKCVAILYEFRDCCIRTGRYLAADAKVQVTDDFNLTGGTYPTTNDVRAWSTYRPYYKESIGVIPEGRALPVHDPIKLYDFSWVEVDYELNQADEIKIYGKALTPGTAYYDDAGTLIENREDPTYQRYTGVDETNPKISCSKYWDGYKKSQYAYGTKVAGTHNGWYSGSTLLLYTLKPSIKIGRTDLENRSNSVKESYNISNGEVVAGFRVVPSIKVESGVENHQLVNNGTQSVNVTIEILLPEGLTYRDGTLSFNYEGSGYTPYTMQWEVDYKPETRTLKLTTFVSDIEKVLPELFFDCNIDYNLPQGISLTTTAIIYTEYQEINQIAANTQEDTDTLLVQKPYRSGIAKDVGETLLESGNDLVYELRYMKDDDSSSGTDIAIGDILPYNGDGRGTKFHGGYRVTSLDLTFANPISRDAFKENGKIIIENHQTQSNDDSKMNELMNQLNGQSATELESIQVDGLKLSYDLTSETKVEEETLTQLENDEDGILFYFNLPNLRRAEGKDADINVVTIRITLSPLDASNNPISDGDSVQLGNDRYYNSFMEQEFGASGNNSDGSEDGEIAVVSEEESRGSSVIPSNNVYIAVVNRTISGYVWLDQDHDGLFSTTVNAQDSNPDIPLKNVEAYLYDQYGKEAVDVFGHPIEPCSTDKNGYYQFDNLKQGSYKVVFRDDGGDYSLNDVIPFNRLSVTEQKMEAVAGNKSTPNYPETYALSEGPVPLDSAELNTNVLPEKSDIIKKYSGQYTSPNWNLGLYYYPAEITKTWNDIADATRTGSVSFDLEGHLNLDEADSFAAGTYKLRGPINEAPAIVGKNSIVEPNTAFTSNATGPLGEGPTLYQYQWTVGGINLQAEDVHGPIIYTATETESSFDGASSIDSPVMVADFTDNPLGFSFSAENTPLGGLKVSKVVVPADQKEPDENVESEEEIEAASLEADDDQLTVEDTDTVFRFKVTLYDPSEENVATEITGNYGGMIFNEGVAKFTLTHGDFVLAENLPVGLHYKVEENQDWTGKEGDRQPSHYENVSGAEFTGVIADKVNGEDSQTKEPATVVFTNRHSTGSLSVTKKVEGPVTNSKEEFTFTVTLSNKDGSDTHLPVSGKYGDLEFENSSATFTLKANKSKTATGLPAGLTYTVSEAEVSGYEVKYTPVSGEIEKDSTVSVEVLNTRETGGLTVEKKVESRNIDTGQEFNFKVTLSDETNDALSITGKFGDMEFKNNVAEFMLKHGDSLTATGLPTGIAYSVEEDTEEGYTTIATGNTGTIEKGQTPTALFTNTRDTGDLVISKTVKGRDGDKELKFIFEITLSDTSINGKYGDAEFTKGKAEVSLADGDSASITGLPTGIEYTVTETSADNYTSESTGASGTIEKGHTPTAAFTNTRDTGDLVISKTVEGKDINPEQEFTFTVTLDNKKINGTYGDLTFTDGVATVTLVDGDTKTATGLPTPIDYTVTEKPTEGYTQINPAQTTTPDDGDAGVESQDGYSETLYKDETKTAAFTNRRDTSELTVTKTVDGDFKDLDKEFTFTITLEDSSVNGLHGAMTFENGVAKVTLKSGDSKTATELPVGVGYTVEESDNEGYTVTSTGETGTIEKGSTASAAFTNTRDTGSLEVKKTVEGDDGEKDKDFNFTVELSDDSINGKFGDMDFEDGVAKFTLRHGQTKEATGLPTLIEYKVLEAEDEEYTATAENATGTITKEGVTATFVNKRQTGSLIVQKTVEGTDPDPEREFEFTITLSDDSITGNYGDVDFVDGVAVITLKDGESKTAKHLPLDVKYTVTEKDYPNYVVTKDHDSGQIIDSSDITAHFINKRFEGDISKVQTSINNSGLQDTDLTENSDGSLTGPSVKAGDEITYQINWTNFSDETADVIITDLLDEGVDFISASDGGVYDNDSHTVTWEIPDQEPGEQGTVEVTVRVNNLADYAWDYDRNNPGAPDAGNHLTNEEGVRKSDHRIVNQAFVEIENKTKATNSVTNPLEGLYIEKIHAVVSSGSEDGYKQNFFADGGEFDLPKDAVTDDSKGFTEKYDQDTEVNDYKKTFAHESGNTVRYYLKVTNNYKNDLEHVVIMDPVKINSLQETNQNQTNFNGIAGVINNRPEVEGRTQQNMTVTPVAYDPDTHMITYKLLTNWNETWGDANVTVENIIPVNARFVSASYVKDPEKDETLELKQGESTRTETEGSSVIPAISLDGPTIKWEFSLQDEDPETHNIMYLTLQFDNIDSSTWEQQSCGTYGTRVTNVIDIETEVDRTNNIKAIFNQDDIDGDGSAETNEGYLRWELDKLPGTVSANQIETSTSADGYPSNVQIVYFCWDMPEGVDQFTSWENTAYVETMANLQEKLKSNAKTQKKFEDLETALAQQEADKAAREIPEVEIPSEPEPEVSEWIETPDSPGTSELEDVDTSEEVEDESEILDAYSLQAYAYDIQLLADESDIPVEIETEEILDTSNDNSSTNHVSVYSTFGWRDLTEMMIPSNTVKEVMKAGNLEIKKQVVGESRQDKEFSFIISLDFSKVLLTDSDTSKFVKNFNILNGNGDLTGFVIANGSGTFTLKDGQSVRIENLPVGTQFTITELDTSAYTVTGSVDYPDGAALSDKNTPGPVISGEITSSLADVKVLCRNTLNQNSKIETPDQKPEDKPETDTPSAVIPERPGQESSDNDSNNNNSQTPGNNNQSSNNSNSQNSSSSSTNTVQKTNTVQTTTTSTQSNTNVTTVGIAPQTGLTGTMILLPLIGMAVGGTLLERNHRSKKKKDHEDSER